MKKNTEDERRIEDVFLAYVNYSLRDKSYSSVNLYNIIKTIYKRLPLESWDVEALIKTTFLVQRFNLFHIEGKSPLDKIIKKEFCKHFACKQVNNSTYEIAKNAVYLYKNNRILEFCEQCHIRTGYWSQIPNKSELYFIGPGRINCLQCSQLVYMNILKELVSNKKDYTEVNGFKKFVISPDLIKSTEVIEYENKEPKKQILRKEIKLEVSIIDFFVNSYVEGKTGFTYLRVLDSCIAYSLREFLTQDERNRERIKLCSDCNKFFVTSKFDPRIKKCPECSPKSKKTKEYNREYAKRYRKILKEQRNAKEKAATIKKYMEKAMITREEAEKIWRLDHKA